MSAGMPCGPQAVALPTELNTLPHHVSLVCTDAAACNSALAHVKRRMQRLRGPSKHALLRVVGYSITCIEDAIFQAGTAVIALGHTTQCASINLAQAGLQAEPLCLIPCWC